jgi:hypothetical protein
MELNDLRLDLDAVEEGAWFPFGNTGAEVKIARWNNKEHLKFLKHVNTKYGRKMASGAMSDDEANVLLAQQWQHILRDWKGVTINGEEVPWSAQVVTDLASNAQYEAFFENIQNISKSEANFRMSSVIVAGED